MPDSVAVAALAHGEAYIGQVCLLTPDEIVDLARRVGITVGMSVLDMGSGTEGPACYLAQQFGCHVLGVDTAMVGPEQAVAGARHAGTSHLVPFRLGDMHTVALYLERRVEFEAIWRPERYQEGLERLQISQHCAIIGVLGQLAYIAEQ